MQMGSGCISAEGDTFTAPGSDVELPAAAAGLLTQSLVLKEALRLFLSAGETSRVAQQSRRRRLSIQKFRRLERRQVANVNDLNETPPLKLMASLLLLLLRPEGVWPPFNVNDFLQSGATLAHIHF